MVLSPICKKLIAFSWAILVVQYPYCASADGALAVGLTGDVVNDGYSIGSCVNKASEGEARACVLVWCRVYGSPKTNGKCEIIISFRKQCVAEAVDPKTGMSGVGWAVAKDKDTAEKMALAKCAETAGRERSQFCRIRMDDKGVTTTLCDTKP